MPALVEVDNLTLRYATDRGVVTATDRVSFSVHQADRFILLGASGCGKSTILKAVGGFLKPSEGTIKLAGMRVTAPGPDRVFVFQEFDQLLPWKTVRDNIVFALTATNKMGTKEARERAAHYLAKVNLTEFADAYPHTLSGGMKQRGAIARALAMEPRVLLMDEPFAALDALTRLKMQEELLRLWHDMPEASRFTVLFVTHSIMEAIRVGNRILMLSPHPGRVKGEIASNGKDEVEADGRRLSERIQQELFGEQGAE
jgi:NitT/TauT family transport system ATP-binding protein